MTTPSERKNAQLETKQFLEALRDPELSPDVPEKLRQRAETLLRHLASPGEIEDVLEISLRLFYAERERDELRASATEVTWRVLLRGTILLGAVLLLGIWVGTVMPR